MAINRGLSLVDVVKARIFPTQKTLHRVSNVDGDIGYSENSSPGLADSQKGKLLAGVTDVDQIITRLKFFEEWISTYDK